MGFGVWGLGFGVWGLGFGVFKPDFGVIKCEFVVKFCVKVYGIINVKGMESYYPLRLCKSSINFMYIVDCYNYSGNVVGYKMW